MVPRARYGFWIGFTQWKFLLNGILWYKSIVDVPIVFPVAFSFNNLLVLVIDGKPIPQSHVTLLGLSSKRIHVGFTKTILVDVSLA